MAKIFAGLWAGGWIISAWMSVGKTYEGGTYTAGGVGFSMSVFVIVSMVLGHLAGKDD